MKKFLTTFAGLAAAFASEAGAMSQTATNDVSVQDTQNMAAPQATVLGENFATTDAKGDQYNFVLKKSEDTGQLMAWHSSHSSHASHASHSSHYSSR